MHFFRSVDAAAKCIGPSSGKQRPPQDDNPPAGIHMLRNSGTLLITLPSVR